MLQTHNKIILVDNNEEHLTELSKSFFEYKISCLPIVYDVTYSSPINGVRLAFFDLNLLDSSNESLILSTVVDALPKYIDKDNGPFALIFWTDKKEYVPKLKEYIQERGLKIPKPFLVDCIDKDECYGQPEKLNQRLKEIFSSEILSAIIEYENTVIASATETTNQFFTTIPTDDEWGYNENFIKNFDKIFSKIAASTLGIGHAKENPDLAVHTALTGNLNYHIKNFGNSGKWKSILKTLSSAQNEKEIALIDGYNYYLLNNLLHVNDKASELKKNDRGVVISLEKELLFEFKTDFATFYTSIIPLDKSIVNKSSRKQLRDSSELICVEISAGCDYSQQKRRVYKYLIGILTPEIKDKQIDFSQMSGSSLKVIDFVSLTGKNMQLWLNLNFMLGLDLSDSKLKEIKFGLKSDLVNYIGNRYANHISRIGITSF